MHASRVADDKMDSWDQAKLESVVKSKDNTSNETKIICKYFLEAIENKKYGWCAPVSISAIVVHCLACAPMSRFWECPNGNTTCKYKHALPPGYVLKSEEKAQEVDEDDKMTIEEEIEEEVRLLNALLVLQLGNSTGVATCSARSWC